MLKRELIKRSCSSQEEKTLKLLENTVMENEKPSQYLRRLQALAGSAVPTDLLRTLWTRGLPEKLKPTMATQTGKTLTDMAKVADTVFNLLHGHSAIHEVVAGANLQAQLQQLPLDYAALKCQMAALVSQVEVSSGGRPHSQRPSLPRSRSRSREPRPGGVCWYHSAFKDRAKKCTSPSAWKPGNHPGSR
jgi:hypothetical protein